jgi:Lon protease-like protein
MAHFSGQDDLSAVPLFPLPNVVLFPRAVLPLHIFEPRYRRMTADALTGDKRIAMALLKDGWQQQYHGRPAIEPVVCVGRIIAHEMLDDGRYNLLLQGERRARVIEEDFSLAYRRGELELLAESPAFDVDLAPAREAMREVVNHSRLRATDLGRELVKVIDSAIPTADLADVCSFSLLEDVAVKQRLLEDADVQRRVLNAVRALREMYPPAISPVQRWGGVSLN